MNVLQAIEARERAATPGPWVNFPVGGPWRYPGVIGASNDSEPACPRICTPVTDGSNDDMEFVAHSRADIPLLLAVAKAAAEVSRWDAEVQEHIRKGLRGETQENVAEISYANSAWSDAMDDLRTALALLMQEVTE